MIGITLTKKAKLHELTCTERDDDGSESHSGRFSFDEGSTFLVRLTKTQYGALKAIPAAKRRRLVVDITVNLEAAPVAEEASGST